MTYVLSDIHGNEGRFRSILEQIDLQSTDVLYVLGDVVDRHPGGVRILRQLMAMPNARLLLGNHEYMMLRALGHPYDDNFDDGGATAHWYRNGGGVTHAKWKLLRKSLRTQILEYLRALPLHYDIEVNGTAYRLVHAAPAERFDAEGGRYRNPVHYAVWKRLTPEDALPGGYTLIFGHTPTCHFRDTVPMEVWYGDGRIGIDCGCGWPEGDPRGRLCCLRLEDGKVFYSGEG